MSLIALYLKHKEYHCILLNSVMMETAFPAEIILHLDLSHICRLPLCGEKLSLFPSLSYPPLLSSLFSMQHCFYDLSCPLFFPLKMYISAAD